MNELVKGGIYRHFKGNIYKVIDIATNSEDLSECVIYERVNQPGKLWVRPKDMFLSEVDHDKYPEVKQKYRFELISKE